MTQRPDHRCGEVCIAVQRRMSDPYTEDCNNMKSVFLSLKHMLPLVVVGLVAVGQASATPTCATSVLALTSAQIVTGQGSVGCEVTTTPPGLALSGNVVSAAIQPAGLAQISGPISRAEATWSVSYSGTGPATTTLAYDVIFGGSSSQPITWALTVGTPGGTLPLAGGAFTLTEAGIKELTGSETVSTIVPGSYTFDLSASSVLPFNVSVPTGTTVDIPNPTANSGVPEPASIATLGIGLAAGLLFVGKRRKKE
jgi:PEP-CTERM motif